MRHSGIPLPAERSRRYLFRVAGLSAPDTHPVTALPRRRLLLLFCASANNDAAGSDNFEPPRAEGA